MSLADELNLYQKRTVQSKQWGERAHRVMPGGISHEIRSHHPHPFVVRSSSGPFLTDVDGNTYLDFWMGHYSHILGHSPRMIRDCIRRHLEKGILWGCLHETEIELAELLCKVIPSAEKVRFCTTGTEATMFAVRLARGFTGKKLVFKMTGGWHGPSSELFHGVSGRFDRSESLGIPGEIESDIRTLPFNDSDRCREILDVLGTDDVAAIIVEPMLGSSWFIPANPEFLRFLRDECTMRGALLIFDEIITGFRLAPGGAQELYGILPDLTTLGKVIGAGMPIAVVAGRRDVMDRCDPSSGLQKWERVRIGGGTFSCHPLSMVAALTLVRRLVDQREAIYPKLDETGKKFREDLAAIFTRKGFPVAVTGIGSLFTPHFLYQDGPPPQNPHDALTRCNYPFKEKTFKLMLMNRGIHVMHGGGAISTAHTRADLDRTLESMEQIAAIMADDHGILESIPEL